MILELTYVGEDDWNRRVYQDSKKNYYKTYEEVPSAGNLFTSSGFYGEPDFSLKGDIIIKLNDHKMV